MLDLHEDSHFNEYIRISPDLKDNYPESIIINEFCRLVDIIQIQLKETLTNKRKQLNNYIESLIKEVIQEDEELSKMIDHKKATIFIKNKVSNIVNLESKTANELNQLDLYKANKNILISQITNTLFEYCQNI